MSSRCVPAAVRPGPGSARRPRRPGRSGRRTRCRCCPSAAAEGGDRGVDPDHPAVQVDQRTAGVAGVDRGVGLDHRLGGRAPLQRADHARGDGAVEAQRRADGDHRLTDPQVGADARAGRRQVTAAGPQHGDVVVSSLPTTVGATRTAGRTSTSDTLRAPATTWWLVSTCPGRRSPPRSRCRDRPGPAPRWAGSPGAAASVLPASALPAAPPGPRRSCTIAVGAGDAVPWSSGDHPGARRRAGQHRQASGGDESATRRGRRCGPAGRPPRRRGRREPEARRERRRVPVPDGPGGAAQRMSGPAGGPSPRWSSGLVMAVSFRTFVGLGAVRSAGRTSAATGRRPRRRRSSPSAARYGVTSRCSVAPADRGADVGVDVAQLLTALGGVRGAAGGLGQLSAALPRRPAPGSGRCGRGWCPPGCRRRWSRPAARPRRPPRPPASGERPAVLAPSDSSTTRVGTGSPSASRGHPLHLVERAEHGLADRGAAAGQVQARRSAPAPGRGRWSGRRSTALGAGEGHHARR